MRKTHHRWVRGDARGHGNSKPRTQFKCLGCTGPALPSIGGLRLCAQSCLFETPWNVAHWAPLFMGFPSKNTGVGCPFSRGSSRPRDGTCVSLGRFDPAAAAAKSHQSCPTLYDPIDGGPPGSRPWDSPSILEWVAISFSSAGKWKVKVKLLSCVQLFATPWTIAYQAPPSMGFPRQEYWSGVPLPSPIK